MENDLKELAALNQDYITSVQRSDVKRFNEILAQEFYCSNPDNTLVDRAGFLKQTALPVAIILKTSTFLNPLMDPAPARHKAIPLWTVAVYKAKKCFTPFYISLLKTL
jgi:hypothetical protein